MMFYNITFMLFYCINAALVSISLSTPLKKSCWPQNFECYIFIKNNNFELFYGCFCSCPEECRGIHSRK